MDRLDQANDWLCDFNYRFNRLHRIDQEIEYLLEDGQALHHLQPNPQLQHCLQELHSVRHLLSLGSTACSAGAIYLQLTFERQPTLRPHVIHCATAEQLSFFAVDDFESGIPAYPLVSNVALLHADIKQAWFLGRNLLLCICHNPSIAVLWSLHSGRKLAELAIPEAAQWQGVRHNKLRFKLEDRELLIDLEADVVLEDHQLSGLSETTLSEEHRTVVMASHTVSRGESLIQRRMKIYPYETSFLITDCDGALRVLHQGGELRIIVLGDHDTVLHDVRDELALVSVHSQPNQLFVFNLAKLDQLSANGFWELRNGYFYANAQMEMIKEGLFVLSSEQFITTTWQGFNNNAELLVLELYEIDEDGHIECINEAEQSLAYPLSGVALREGGWVSIFSDTGKEYVWWDKEDEVILDPAWTFTELPDIIAAEMKVLTDTDAVANFSNTDLQCTIYDNHLALTRISDQHTFYWYFDRKPAFAEAIRNDLVIIIQSDLVSSLALVEQN